MYAVMALSTSETARAERSNAEWLSQLRGGAGTRAAFADLQRLLHRVLLRALAPRGVDEDTVADFVQEAVTRINNSLDSFRGDSRFTTWASAVAMRTALSALRRAHWRDVPLDSLDLDTLQLEPLAGRQPSPERAARQQQIEKLLEDVVNRELTPRQRQVIVGELAGVPQEMLLERLAINRNALYKLAHDARRKLKAALERAGVRAEDVRDLIQRSSE